MSNYIQINSKNFFVEPAESLYLCDKCDLAPYCIHVSGPCEFYSDQLKEVGIIFKEQKPPVKEYQGG